MFQSTYLTERKSPSEAEKGSGGIQRHLAATLFQPKQPLPPPSDARPVKREGQPGVEEATLTR